LEATRCVRTKSDTSWANLYENSTEEKREAEPVLGAGEGIGWMIQKGM